uniref:Uncharacterized protein n=1 Tax=Arundo donax TaxID=35708 RepID=A0A0A9FZU2_ARUDO
MLQFVALAIICVPFSQSIPAMVILVPFLEDEEE